MEKEKDWISTEMDFFCSERRKEKGGKTKEPGNDVIRVLTGT